MARVGQDRGEPVGAQPEHQRRGQRQDDPGGQRLAGADRRPAAAGHQRPPRGAPHQRVDVPVEVAVQRVRAARRERPAEPASRPAATRDGTARRARSMVGTVVTSSSSMIRGLVSRNSDRSTSRAGRRSPARRRPAWPRALAARPEPPSRSLPVPGGPVVRPGTVLPARAQPPRPGRRCPARRRPPRQVRATGRLQVGFRMRRRRPPATGRPRPQRPGRVGRRRGGAGGRPAPVARGSAGAAG